MFQKMGLVRDYFALRGGELTEADMGRFNVTRTESDRHFFKVPTLRNIAQTAPYFHDGSQETLGGAVRIMGQVQLNLELTDAQVADIVAFLGALTGELPAHARLPMSARILPTPAAPAE
jgi:cytochrome c peroxidase